MFSIFMSGSIDLPVNSDAVTRAELRRTRLDLIRREYEVNTLLYTYTLCARISIRIMRSKCIII